MAYDRDTKNWKVGDFLLKKTGDIWKVTKIGASSLSLVRVSENGVVKTPERKGKFLAGEYSRKITKEYAVAQINLFTQIIENIDLQKNCLHQMNEIAGLCCCEEICPCKVNSCATSETSK